jgi:hypothetical protein
MKPAGVSSKHSERGQALAEVALFSLLAVILAFGLLSLIPMLRARTAAASAAYACAQFLSQSPNRSKAANNAYNIAWQTLKGDWSATLGVDYQVEVAAPSGSGQPGACAVHYCVKPLFGGLGLIDPGWSTGWFVSRSETWKAKW